MANKVLLIGRAATGKTSIKKVIFEGAEPRELMIHPLPPTRGLETSVYAWMDLSLGLFDSAGQELDSLLENEEEQKKAFGNTNAIIYVLDYLLWTANSIEITKEIHKIYNIIKERSSSAKFIVFFHKIDLINQKLLRNFDILERDIRTQLNIEQHFPIYFTSIYPNLIFNTYNAFFEILSSLSPETNALKNILDLNIKDYPKMICFITNQHNSIVVQTISKDFTIEIVNHLHRFISQLDLSYKNLAALYNEVQLVDSGPTIVSMILDSLEDISPNIKHLMCISEIHKIDKLVRLMAKIKTEISKYYKKE